jgi:putative SbcD/Mre11-related phosphoesterase
MIRDAKVVGTWVLTPEGAVIHEREAVAVIADVHLGYEWARGVGGDTVPEHSLRETLAKLERILDRARITRLIVAGDLVESARPCPRTNEDVRRLRGWLERRGVELVLLQGNHDRPADDGFLETITVDGWTIGHGHRPVRGPRVVVGHHHPRLRVGSVSAPCFLVGATLLVLPAFSENAVGLNIAAATLPEPLRGQPWRCLACAGDDVLDFGPLADLTARLRVRR